MYVFTVRLSYLEYKPLEERKLGYLIHCCIHTLTTVPGVLLQMHNRSLINTWINIWKRPLKYLYWNKLWLFKILFYIPPPTYWTGIFQIAAYECWSPGIVESVFSKTNVDLLYSLHWTPFLTYTLVFPGLRLKAKAPCPISPVRSLTAPVPPSVFAEFTSLHFMSV